MDDAYKKIEVSPDYYESAETTNDPSQTQNMQAVHFSRSRSHSCAVGRVTGAGSLLNLFTRTLIPWGSENYDDKVQLSRAEVESLRSEIADSDERAMQLKAQLEHLDEILRSARLSGYLYIRTRWTQLPGEPPILDDADVDDWLPRFVILQGLYVFYYLKSTDLSPQDSTLLSDVVEVGSLPSFTQEDQQTKYAFYILTCQGLRFECSSHSKIQVESWLTALMTDCALESKSDLKDSIRS